MGYIPNVGLYSAYLGPIPNLWTGPFISIVWPKSFLFPIERSILTKKKTENCSRWRKRECDFEREPFFEFIET